MTPATDQTVTKNRWLQPGFLIVVVLLAVCALGLNAAIAMLKLHLIKQPVALRQSLSDIPQKMGDWLQVSYDEPLDHELQDTLGTDKYIFRDYVNTSAIGWDDLVRLGVRRGTDKQSLSDQISSLFAGKGSRERKEIVSALQLVKPDAVVSLAVTYYTGGVDTVAHIPERCYVADGWLPKEDPENVMWDMGPGRLNSKPGGDQRIAVRFLNFEDQTGAKRVTKRVAYFFFANGVYESDPVGVRETLQDLRVRHGFYSKVELMTLISDHDQCAKVMSGFLTTVMPEIERCYPDWNSVEHSAVK